MPVNVIGTLKPKNNGKFPVAEAVDIKVTEDLRLDEALENKADLETLNYALANKADKTMTTALQAQIDNIVTPVTQDAEVENARVGANGLSYNTLKARLDAEENTQNNALSVLESVNSNVFDIYSDTDNIFDKRRLLKNHAYQIADGVLIPNDTYSSTIKFKMKAGYSCIRASQAPNRIFVWNADGTLDNVYLDKYAVVATQGQLVAFRFPIADLDADTLMIGYTTETTGTSTDTWTDIFGSDYIPYNEKYTLNGANVDVPAIDSKLHQYFTAGGGKNKYVPDELLVGYAYTQAEGKLVQNANYKCTPIIKITDKTKSFIYSSVSCYRYCFYDQNKNYIARDESSTHAYTHEAAYVSLTYLVNDDLTNLMISFVDTVNDAPAYEPAVYGLDESNVICPTAEKLKELATPINNLIFDELSNYVSVDTDYQKMITLQGTSGTSIWYDYKAYVAPKTVLNISITAKTDKDASADSSYGAFCDIKFFDKDYAQIGTKYNLDIISMSRFAYHRYQVIAPAGTAYYLFRIITKSSTKLQIKEIKIDNIPVMPTRPSNGVIHDCHLGTLLYAPQNTISAYEMARLMGFENLIINVKRTSDNKLVCIHNTTIDETSNGTGNVSSYTYNQLLAYDFGSWFSKYYTGEKIPLCDDVMEFIAKSGMNVLVSIHSTNTTADIDDVYALIKKYNLLGKCMIKSYFTNHLEYAYSKFGDNCMYDLVRESSLDNEIKTWISSFGHLDYIETTYGIISTEYVAECHDLGVNVIGGITSDPKNVSNAIKCGVKRFTSDMCADMIC